MTCKSWVSSPLPTDYRFINLTGMRFDRLIVESFAGRDKLKHFVWTCICDCGNYTFVLGNHLKRGATRSCGCYHADATRKAKLIHGHTARKSPNKRSPEYSSWSNMKTRCYNPKSNRFEFYGALGVIVCDRWLYGDGGKSGFECFLLDMGPKPSMEYSLDRYPNKDGNYERDNCRWATMSEQMKNRRPFVHKKNRNIAAAEDVTV